MELEGSGSPLRSLSSSAVILSNEDIQGPEANFEVRASASAGSPNSIVEVSDGAKPE